MHTNQNLIVPGLQPPKVAKLLKTKNSVKLCVYSVELCGKKIFIQNLGLQTTMYLFDLTQNGAF